MKIMMKQNSIKEIVNGVHNDTQHQKSSHPKTRPKDCDRAQLTNAQCHMVPISKSWYREPLTIQTKQERITVSYHPTHHHGHTNKIGHDIFVHTDWSLYAVCLCYFNFDININTNVRDNYRSENMWHFQFILNIWKFEYRRKLKMKNIHITHIMAAVTNCKHH